MTKFSLGFDYFSQNIKDYLKQEQDFLNVTLACDVDQLIKAHKVILSAGSLFFRNILSNSKHPEPFIFLTGVRMNILKNIIELIYTGETIIAEDEIGNCTEAARHWN